VDSIVKIYACNKATKTSMIEIANANTNDKLLPDGDNVNDNLDQVNIELNGAYTVENDKSLGF
jgi:hypothetical protein